VKAIKSLVLQNSSNIPKILSFSRNPGWKIPGIRKEEARKLGVLQLGVLENLGIMGKLQT
jgi:hypothetical protein